jgi:hypothetical protein
MISSVFDRSQRRADAMLWIWMAVAGAFLLGMNFGLLLMGMLAAGRHE